MCVNHAKVPIVKIWDPELQLACDMNVNNTLALENTRMIKTYVEIDERVRPLAMIIKYWTRKRILNDAGRSLKTDLCRKSSNHMLSCISSRRNAQLIHMDMYDLELSANPQSPGPTVFAQATTSTTAWCRWKAFCLRRRSHHLT